MHTKPSIKSVLTIATSTLGLALLAPTAQAAIISGVTASTAMGSLASSNIANTVNGVGLPGDAPSLSGLHAEGDPANAWITFSSSGSITFNLNGSYDLSGFSFWNFNALGLNYSGIKGVTVQSSTDGSIFSDIPGAPTEFALGNDGSPQLPEIISFSPVTASYVRFNVTSNWGGTFTAFSEVQFAEGTPAPVPEPTGIVGLLAVGGVFLTTKRRRA